MSPLGEQLDQTLLLNGVQTLLEDDDTLLEDDGGVVETKIESIYDDQMTKSRRSIDNIRRLINRFRISPILPNLDQFLITPSLNHDYSFLFVPDESTLPPSYFSIHDDINLFLEQNATFLENFLDDLKFDTIRLNDYFALDNRKTRLETQIETATTLLTELSDLPQDLRIHLQEFIVAAQETISLFHTTMDQNLEARFARLMETPQLFEEEKHVLLGAPILEDYFPIAQEIVEQNIPIGFVSLFI